MRQAVTLALSHDGKWTTIRLPDVPIQEQIEQAKQLSANRLNEDYARVIVQEIDPLKNYKFESQSKVDARAESQKKAEAEALKAKAKAEKEKQKAEKNKAESLAAHKSESHKQNTDFAKKLAESRANRLQAAKDETKAQIDAITARAKAQADKNKQAAGEKPAETPTKENQ